jgi:glutamine synthetase
MLEYFLDDDIVLNEADDIDKWIEYKMENEVNPLKLQPAPSAFALHNDC